MKLKDKLKSLERSRFLIPRSIFVVLKALKHGGLFLTNGRFRSEFLANFKFKGHYYQKSVHTAVNRYPLLFAQCRDRLANVAEPKIMSFGCSTGAEVFTLGEYLPNAQVIGIDINEWCLKQCKKKYRDKRFSFFHRLSPQFTNAHGFDAIFCMAVFQRTENRTSTADVVQGFSFEQFENEVTLLDAKLKPSGLLVIDHADFNFTETVCSAHYKPLAFELNQMERFRPLFDRNNVKIADIQFNFRMFQKQID